MKSKKIQMLEMILRWMAIAVLKKYKPLVIGITGSVGKTSAKEAVFLVLSSKFRVRKNEKNYNNEIGIPLTVIGSESGGRSLWGWVKVTARWTEAVVFPFRYPEVLVLEMGVDRPGDMKYLASFIPLKIGVVTSISSSHLEFFKNVDQIAKEKGKILEGLGEDGVAILNADDEKIFSMKDETRARVITFGFEEKADLRASHVTYVQGEKEPEGIAFKLNYEGKFIPVRLPHVLASHQIGAVLAGAAAGIALKINLVDIAEALEQFSAPPGRMKLIKGIKDSLVIDDTYNASPASAVAALTALENLRALRKIAVLGDMLELGKEMEKGHRQVARKVFEINADLFFAVGERMKLAMNELETLGYSPERMHYFESPQEASRILKEFIKKGDLVLVKGSQSMRMEKIVEGLMAEPDSASKLLCRQSAEWRNRPFAKP
ncbi:MAG: UDP-N-acetylmuramoyl-tripeptide--D-alanyl-D-alanine ligase [Candidatus Moranbacteria bacterium]|nr:UDP-N-acetylmuramoyl-tripeptide--D-alanyl-D-alanine ligase [Candidatus Moranbacteria bacterium]